MISFIALGMGKEVGNLPSSHPFFQQALRDGSDILRFSTCYA